MDTAGFGSDRGTGVYAHPLAGGTHRPDGGRFVYIAGRPYRMQHAALRANMGLGILPCLLGEADEQLFRLPQMPVQEGPMLWLLTHPDLRNTRRIQVFMAFVRDLFARRLAALQGELQGAMTEDSTGAYSWR